MVLFLSFLYLVHIYPDDGLMPPDMVIERVTKDLEAFGPLGIILDLVIVLFITRIIYNRKKEKKPKKKDWESRFP
jgi:hypothetical protein